MLNAIINHWNFWFYLLGAAALGLLFVLNRIERRRESERQEQIQAQLFRARRPYSQA